MALYIHIYIFHTSVLAAVCRKGERATADMSAIPAAGRASLINGLKPNCKPSQANDKLRKCHSRHSTFLRQASDNQTMGPNPGVCEMVCSGKCDVNSELGQLSGNRKVELFRNTALNSSNPIVSTPSASRKQSKGQGLSSHTATSSSKATLLALGFCGVSWTTKRTPPCRHPVSSTSFGLLIFHSAATFSSRMVQFGLILSSSPQFHSKHGHQRLHNEHAYGACQVKDIQFQRNDLQLAHKGMTWLVVSLYAIRFLHSFMSMKNR